jgi:hypothetical protein
VINLPGLAELQQLIRTLEETHVRVVALGDPSRLAGDPPAIRRLAEAHRRSARALRSVQDQGQAHVRGVTQGGFWYGTASVAFMGHWSHVQTRIGDLASSHDQMGFTLDGIAEEAARLNSDHLTALGSGRSWLEAAAGALLRMDAGEIVGLLARGRIVLSDWHQVLGDIERFIGSLAGRVSAALDFQVHPVSIPILGPGLGPQITVPLPGKPGGPLVNVPWPGTPHGPQITVPLPGKPSGPLVNVPWPGMPHGPLITVPLPKARRDINALSKKGGGTGTKGPNDGGRKPGRGTGPSGGPKIHIVRHPTLKRAKDAARQRGRGAPIKHPSPRKGDPHFHSADENGNVIRDGVHHVFPRRFS